VVAQDAPKPAPAAARAAGGVGTAAAAAEVVCFESRKGATEVTQRELKPGCPT
jgi:hypothetical protein